MTAVEVRIGDRFARLVVTAREGRHYDCICDCGQPTRGRRDHLIEGRKRSCGCLVKEFNARRVTHGACIGGSSPEYSVWSCMRARCYNSASKSFKDYGGRGITVCDRWDDFANFLADLGPRPSLLHSIERNDVNGHYEPLNCHWATKLEQAKNTRSVRLSVDKVRAIRTLREQGLTHRAIAAQFGVVRTTVTAVLRQVNWSDVA